MIESFLDGMGALLAFFYRIIPNYGVAIILLTVTVRLLLFPLTAKGIRSMQAMQRIQPEIKKLQAKYKHDRQKLNEEMMKFYQENKINPFGGCLPLLAQAPVFMALYRVLTKLKDHTPVDSRLYHDICGSVAPGDCDPKGLDFLGMDLSTAATADHGAWTSALPYFILVGLVIATAYLQQVQSMRRQQQVNPQMQMIARIMPVFFGFISLNLPSGVVLYFLTSNVWQMGQQSIIYRHADEEPRERAGRGGLMGRLLWSQAARPDRAEESATEPEQHEEPQEKAPTKKPQPRSRKRGKGKRRRR
ncbi:MAG: YidC/Oxa1 family membrane protein insertase [Acidimicrobiia bacterium]|nr:YidC/Oxa1 family membrane protein insertase [Acidimicrobiia bacterium]